MSIVVAVQKGKNIVMAADTLTSRGNERMPEQNTSLVKFVRAGGSLLGGAGWTIYDNILRDYLKRTKVGRLQDEVAIYTFFVRFWEALKDRYTLVNDQGPEKDRAFADLEAEFLVANRSGLYEVAPDMGVTRCKRYVAIGSGAPYALGALQALYDRIDDPGELASEAVRTAMLFDVHCGGTVSLAAV